MKKFNILYVCLGITLLLSSCYPNQGNSIEELDLVITYRNETTNFATYNTYVVADTVVFISDDGKKTLDDDEQKALIDKVDNSLMAYGWTKENNPQTNGSDVAVFISVITTENFIISTGWWDYWGGWYGWGNYYGYSASTSGYYGGYYPGYPGYCCYTSVYPYTTGTVLIEMVDPNNSANNAVSSVPMPILWLGAIDGLAEDTRKNIKGRIDESVDIMFEDSPYLKKN